MTTPFRLAPRPVARRSVTRRPVAQGVIARSPLLRGSAAQGSVVRGPVARRAAALSATLALGGMALTAAPASANRAPDARHDAPLGKIYPSPDTGTTSFDAGGVRVIYRHATANNVVAANLYLLGGTRQLTPETAGIEALLLEASQRGTRHY